MTAASYPSPSFRARLRDRGGEVQTGPPQAIAAARKLSRTRGLGLRPADAFLPTGLVLWTVGVLRVDPRAMNDFGLLPALPVIYFIGVGLLVGSIAWLLAQTRLSPVRLGVHLVVLVVALHGTLPLIFSSPNFPWVYKHIGVVAYIDLHGGLDSSVDIYHNWPGFFALAAWFTRVAGVGSPLTYAAWAPVYFNLLICLELAFVLRFLPVTRRVRWLGLFLFVAGNWVGQDYFAPQALAFVLSLAVFGILLSWFQVDRPPAVVRMIRRLASYAGSARQEGFQEAQPEPAVALRPAPPRLVAFAALFTVFMVSVATHQLSPYVIILGIGLLTMAGMIRPRWLVVGLIAVAVGYLFLHRGYIERTQDLFGSLGDPLQNVHDVEPNDSVPMRGRKLTALAAPALILGMWMLGMVGVVRQLRARRTVLIVALLAASPALVALGQSYGGEAVFRIFLFSLPWTAVLGGCALDPNPRRGRLWSAAKVSVALSVTLALFMSAFFGAEELYRVRPGEVAASQYFYDNAEPGSVLTLTAPNFPTRVSGRYDQFRTAGDNLPNLLTTGKQFRHRMLGPDDLPAIAEFVDHYVSGAEGAGGRYLVLSTGQEVYAQVLGLLPPGSLASLGDALAASADWRVFYRGPDAVIYESLRPQADRPDGTGPGAVVTRSLAPSPAASPAPADEPDGVAIVTGLLGMVLIAVATRRKWAGRSNPELALNEEEMMNNTAATHVPDPETDVKEAVEIDPTDLMVPDGDMEDLVRRAMLAPPPDRQPFRLALSNLPPPEPGRFGELVAGVEPAQRAEAVHLLGEAWGPVPSAQLRTLLDDESGSVRAAAVAVLDLSGEAVAELCRLLRDDMSCAVRRAAIQALAEAPEDDQRWALSVALEDPEPEVRARAIDTLPVARTDRTSRSILAASEDPAEQVRQAAYRRLVGIQPWRLWLAIGRCTRRDELCAVLRQESTQDRLAALVLERMTSPEPCDRILALELAARLDVPGRLKESVNALQDPEVAVRRAAVAQLRGHTEAAPGLIAVLQGDPDPVVRAESASALDGAEVERARVALIGALHDPAREVQRMAIEVLVRSSSAGLAERVAKGLTTANRGSTGQVLLRMGAVGENALVTAAIEGPRDRSMAAAELLRGTGKVESLLRGLGGLDPDERLRGVEALGALGHSDALAAEGLVTALSDSQPRIRSRAAFHLGQVGHKAGRQLLEGVTARDHSPEVLRAARNASRLIETRARHSGLRANGELPAGTHGDGSRAMSTPLFPEVTM